MDSRKKAMSMGAMDRITIRRMGTAKNRLFEAGYVRGKKAAESMTAKMRFPSS